MTANTMLRYIRALVASLALLAVATLAPSTASAQAVVKTVLFYSPYCPHCHKVINEDLPPLVERYGQAFEVVGVDVTTEQGSKLYEATMRHFGSDETGVPLMVVGDVMLMGDQEIPQRLPTLIQEGLLKGGVPFPDVPELRVALSAHDREVAETADTAAKADAAPPAAADAQAAPAAAPPAEAPAAAPGGITSSLTGSTAGTASFKAKLLRDPLGNGIAVGVLLALVAAVLVALTQVRRPLPGPSRVPFWLVPALALVGMGVAAYLSFVEMSGASAVCGPVGDCNAVQASEYARLFGVLPVGILGMIGYLGMLAAWGLWEIRVSRAALRALWIMALLGTAFSAYLTFLEPFVIGATCVWCITSAIAVGILLLASTSLVRAPVE